MQPLLQEPRFAAHRLPKQPMFVLIAVLALALSAGFTQVKTTTIPLDDLNELQPRNVKTELVTYKGRKALRAADAAPPNVADGIQLVILNKTEFQDGVIEIELTGEPAANAGEGARGFVGVAFRVNLDAAKDAAKYECFYLRPTNGRVDDQVRRNHSTQYISYPDFPWHRLRKEFPEKYESYADLVPGEWTKVKIEVRGDKARLYVHDAPQPVLVVNDLKQGQSRGQIALWVGAGTVAHFANLRVSKWRRPDLIATPKGGEVMITMWQDLRYGARMLLKTPALTAIVILALALGIGANTAIFSVINAVLLRPLPFDHPEQLLFLNERSPVLDEMSISYPNFIDWRNQNHVFEKIGVYNLNSYNLTGYCDAERILTAQCSADLFTALRANAMIGRVFTNDEDKPGGSPVVVLSYALWQRRFGGQNSVLNQTLTLNGRQYTVIGVMPPEYAFPTRVEMWVPVGQLSGDPNWQERGNHPGLYAVARLKPGATREQAQADMNNVAANLEKQYPDSNSRNGIRIRTLMEVL